jgi:archaellum biogenesis protein FlaJ (TadC family)
MQTLDQDECIENGTISKRTAELLVAAAFWKRIFGVLGILASATLLITFLAVLPAIHYAGGVVFVVTALACVPLGVLLSIYLLRIASAANDLSVNRTAVALENYARWTRAWWKMLGVLFVIAISFTIIMLLLVAFNIINDQWY